MLQRYRLFEQRHWNIPAGHCVVGVQAVIADSKPTCQALCSRGAGCLSVVLTYLLGTLLQRNRLFKLCQHLPAGHCVAGMQAVLVVSKPTCWAMSCWGAGCLSSGIGTYLLGTVLQRYRLFEQRHWNIPAGHCVVGVQAVIADSKPTCQALCSRGAGCLSVVLTYLLGTLLQRYRLFKLCQHLPARHCVAGMQAVLVVSKPTCWAMSCWGAGCLSVV